MHKDVDIVVIGGGIAGVAIAAHLAEHRSVRLLEMEEQPGYHSTGRSAAVFAQTYGNEIIRQLTRASRDFFYDPESGFANAALVRPRSILITARTGQEAALEAFRGSIARGDAIKAVSPLEAQVICPILRLEGLAGAVLTNSLADIDVHELLQAYLRRFKSYGGELCLGVRVVGSDRTGDLWRIRTSEGVMTTGIVVNAAGAWAGQLANLAGAQDIGLTPLKRTVCVIRPPDGFSSDSWPMVLDVEEQFYLKPDAGMLLLSPADETLTEPCDAQADELDMAIAVDRLEQATTLKVRSISSKWAGLRSFVEDRSPVVGYDREQPNFFWFAALGGYGIQTAPALSRLAASLVLGLPGPAKETDLGFMAKAISPLRFAT